jgi:putative transcriptional regulator
VREFGTSSRIRAHRPERVGGAEPPRRIPGGDRFVNGPTLRGRLLVALPPLVDENFDRTVVLMLEHSDGGALGVVLNRPGERDVPSVLEPWQPYTSPPAVIFEGGPVETGSVIGLALADDADDEGPQWAPAFDGIGTIDLTLEPQEAPSVRALRLFAGYAGWAPDQLEQELAAGAWVVAEFRVDDAFGPEPGDLWRSVLRRQGGQVAWMANYPDEISLN